MSKGRSPNYPSLPLRDAIERIRQVYTAEHTHKTDKEVVAKALGYSSLNGKSLPLIGALKRYKLLESDGDGLKVTDNAVTLLELPDSNEERQETLERCAFAHPLFEELRNTYQDILPSDDNLRHLLIKKGFLPKTANEVIHIYRDNLELVAQQNTRYNTGGSKIPDKQEIPPMQQQVSKSTPSNTLPPFNAGSAAPLFDPPTLDEDILTFNLSRTGKAQIKFNGQVTQEALRKLIALLDLSIDTYPTQAELAKTWDELLRETDEDE